MVTIKEILAGLRPTSVLVTLLFLININDLHKSISLSKTYHFAYDASIIPTIRQSA